MTMRLSGTVMEIAPQR